MTCIDALREAAEREGMNDKRFMLLGAATLLQSAIEDFTADPRLETLIHLNGVWSYSNRVLNISPPKAVA